jgi:hypothetical protein
VYISEKFICRRDNKTYHRGNESRRNSRIIAGHVVFCAVRIILSRVGYVTRRISSLCQECSDYLLFFAPTITLYNHTTCALCSSVLANLLCLWPWLDLDYLQQRPSQDCPSSPRPSSSHIATDGQSVSKFWCRAPSGAHDQIFITVWHLRPCFCGAPSLTRGRVCLLYMLLTLTSAIFLRSESLETRDHILLSQI